MYEGFPDENANDLTDFIDMDTLKSGQPTLSELPPLALACDDEARACGRAGRKPAPRCATVRAGGAVRGIAWCHGYVAMRPKRGPFVRQGLGRCHSAP